MPVIDNHSPTTAEDLMASSALAVSPILTASIFDEIYTQQQLDADALAISENSNPDLTPQQESRFDLLRRTDSVTMIGGRRHHRRSHHALPTEQRFAPSPPPSARWRRRLERVVSNTSRNDDEDEDEDYTSSGDEERFSNHIGPVMPTEYSTRNFPRSATAQFVYGQNCLNDRAVDTTPLCTINGENCSNMLDFDVIFDDGGQYGAMYGIENLLLNDGSVYCSGRKGAVNILTQYCGFIESGLMADTSCSISKIVIKAPQHGFTAACKDGLIFISHKEIDVSETKVFNDFTKEQYDAYVANKLQKNGILEDTDPAAWFTLKDDKLCIIDLVNRAGKYVLIKLLRADHDTDNIDMQYIGFIGHSGARSFGSAKLC